MALRGKLPGFLQTSDHDLFHYGVLSTKQHHHPLIKGSLYNSLHFISLHFRLPKQAMGHGQVGQAWRIRSKSFAYFSTPAFHFRHLMSGLALKGREDLLCLLNIEMMHCLLRISKGD